MWVYTDIIDYKMIMQYEKNVARYVKGVVDEFYRQKFKEFDLDVIITISHDSVPCGNTLYNITIFVEPLYKNERILCGGGETGGYTSFIDIINWGFNLKWGKKEKYEIYLEDNFSDLFSEIEDALMDLKTDGMEIDTDEYPERKIFL